jgi:hypothetical protein
MNITVTSICHPKKSGAGHNFYHGHCMCWPEDEKLSCSTWTRRWGFPRQVMEACYSGVVQEQDCLTTMRQYHLSCAPIKNGLLLATTQLPEPKRKGVCICNCTVLPHLMQILFIILVFWTFVISLFLLAWTNIYLPLAIPWFSHMPWNPPL